MADVLADFYDKNPVSVVDQDRWVHQHPEVALQFRQKAVYPPLVDWTSEPMSTGALNTRSHEIMEGDVDISSIPFTQNYVEPLAVDSRQRNYTFSRYGQVVQAHKSEGIVGQFLKSGGKDWRPLLRGVLGNSVVRVNESLARNAFLGGPKAFWTYANDATDFNSIGTNDVFDPAVINEWNLRMGYTGSPIIPGDVAAAKVAIVPPGVTYDLMKALPAASANETALFRDVAIYGSQTPILNNESGKYKNVRFVQAPSNKYGMNEAVLYNAGLIERQHTVTAAIAIGDGAPDPETTQVDGVYYTGQKGATHYIQMESFSSGHYAVNDIVSIHTTTTTDYGVTGGVDPLHGKTIQRRVVAVDATNNRLSFDRPIGMAYSTSATLTSQSSGTGAMTGYAHVSKGKHIGFILVMGSRGGVLGAVAEPLAFHEPVAIDQFNSVFRFSWDSYHGYNMWEPNLFECHFCAITLPKPGGVIAA